MSILHWQQQPSSQFFKNLVATIKVGNNFQFAKEKKKKGVGDERLKPIIVGVLYRPISFI